MKQLYHALLGVVSVPDDVGVLTKGHTYTEAHGWSESILGALRLSNPELPEPELLALADRAERELRQAEKMP